ncbi:hypothetical protein PHYSODRAFT_300720 [Phytophthora sojae]|uniref:Uncharacterized protein n=1 Tax=Phytophthora sojae (strain P6497) TaxID=1094619 RepID=G4ZJ89_PHYSP|nr:hypothetical protein PHYSODRAFT_300720 [Phytophthora sojae]EGZ17753.1 hypothetical protein PHYSODRAFT_300720 [Phytophthora sojae]|eukprot:XP_009526811.1 hypothetical protein PHYSODRAFT_300720 [Phytophthora sojae]
MWLANELMILCRPQVHELWGFLRDEVIAKGKRGFVVGPPGTGKSVGVLSFAASLDREEWDVVWIHLSGAARKPICVDLEAKLWWEISDRNAFEFPVSTTRNYLRAEDKFVTCASLATVRKTNEEDDFVNKIKYFTLHSWTKQEYVEAIADPDFYDTVAAKFDATSTCDVNEADDDSDGELSEAEKKYRALGLKFYYAGGSCRFMFQYRTQVAIQTLTATVDRTLIKDKLFTYCSCAYEDSPINKLYGSQAAKHKRYGERFPVSSFAASLLAEETSEDVIPLLAISVNTRANPGRLFEWLFFASISKHQVRLFFASISKHQVRLFDYAGVEDKLPQARVVLFDPKKRFKRFNTMGLRSSTLSDRIGCGEGEEVKAQQKLRIAGDQLWLRPVVWDQGCYDAVYFDTEEGKVIFVRVAHLTKQDVKMSYINEVLTKLKLAGMEISTVEIFLLPRQIDTAKFLVAKLKY